MTTTTEQIDWVHGRATGDDSGGQPFYEMPCFKTIEEGMNWVEQIKEKNYPCVKLTVDYNVTEWGKYGPESKCLSKRTDTLYQHNTNIADDAEFYARLKGFGQFVDGEWVVIRNQKLIFTSMDEKEALERAWKHCSGRCLVRKAWHETENDDLDTLGKRKRLYGY